MHFELFFLGLWDAMEEYVRHINVNSLDSCFYNAVLAVHQGRYAAAEKYLEEARDVIDTELTAMAAESYSRAYDTMVIVQMLSEVEETMHYKMMPEKRPLICQMWWKRLQECQRTVEDWQKFLQVRSLVLSPDDMRRMWLKFASLCRKNGKMALSHGTLVLLLHYDPNKSEEFTLPLHKPDLTYAYCKHLYCEGRKDLAISQLNLLIESTCKLGLPKHSHEQMQKDLMRLKAKCFLRLGHWTEMNCPENEPPLPQVMLYYRKATEFDKDMYKAWHALACTNFNAVLYYKQKSAHQKSAATGVEAPDDSSKYSPRCSLQNENLITVYAVQAVRCFFRSVALCSGNSLQETLRLLTLWFDYGQNPEVYDALMEGIATVKIETWLQVITQLIARIDTTRHLVNRLITQLLTDIGKEHPHVSELNFSYLLLAGCF
ncbi:unnamed protein product [Soboliphyme baturini]|uniref:FAT domain-containing protein n=1 Tax=Soboliphyme baturini TaxID=241478 RepID=A0A183J7G7_9BILA|nr:unnamed protein product [Soboliphyme baturini]